MKNIISYITEGKINENNAITFIQSHIDNDNTYFSCYSVNGKKDLEELALSFEDSDNTHVDIYVMQNGNGYAIVFPSNWSKKRNDFQVSFSNKSDWYDKAKKVYDENED